MGITLGGIMRGALPVATQQLMNVPADAAARMDKLEARFKVANSAYKEKEAEVLKKQGTIKKLAKNLGVDLGIAKQAYDLSGGSVEKAGKIINNMLSAYTKTGIPTTKVASPEPTNESVVLDNISSVNVAPKDAEDNSIMQSFTNLFKYYSPEKVTQLFAKKMNLPVERVNNILAGSFNLPELQVKRIATPEAIQRGLTTPEKAGADANKLAFFVDFYKRRDYDDEEALSAAQTHVRGNIPLVSPNLQGESIQTIIGKDGSINQTLMDRYGADNQLINPNKKDRDKNEKYMSSGTRTLATIYKVKTLLDKNSQVYTILGRLQKTGSNIASILGQPALAEAMGGPDVTKAIQAAREFIKTTKEAMFDDTRISDRDLAIINQYIGIIADEEFLGVGKANALAAIIALERAAVTQIATALAGNMPGLVRDNKIISYRANGTFNANDVNTIAGKMYGRIMKTYKLNQAMVKNAQRNVEQNKTTQRDIDILTLHENIMGLAENSVNDIIARQTMDAKDFKDNYRNVYLPEIKAPQTGV